MLLPCTAVSAVSEEVTALCRCMWGRQGLLPRTARTPRVPAELQRPELQTLTPAPIPKSISLLCHPRVSTNDGLCVCRRTSRPSGARTTSSTSRTSTSWAARMCGRRTATQVRLARRCCGHMKLLGNDSISTTCFGQFVRLGARLPCNGPLQCKCTDAYNGQAKSSNCLGGVQTTAVCAVDKGDCT